MSATQEISTMSTVEQLKIVKSYLIERKEFEEKMLKIEKAKSFVKYLESIDIKYQYLIKHKEVLGCDESSSYYQRYSYCLGDDYSICKHMLVHERKGDKYFLIIVDSKKHVDLSKIREILDCKKLEFVSSEDMKELIDTVPGNVSIFNIIKDEDKKVQVVFDEELLSYQSLAFHPLYNGMSMFIEPTDCFKFMSSIDRDITVTSVPEKIEEKQIEYVKTLAC